MRTILLLLIMIVLILVGITFGVQNSQLVEIKFVKWPSGPIPLWVVSYASALVGALLVLCGCLVTLIKAKAESRHLKKQIKELEAERDATRNIGVTHSIPPAPPLPEKES